MAKRKPNSSRSSKSVRHPATAPKHAAAVKKMGRGGVGQAGGGSGKGEKSVGGSGGGGARLAPLDARDLRELFWQNVMREMLTSLAILTSEGAAAIANPSHPESKSVSERVGNALDGRLSLVTVLGERIPIAGVVPLFAQSVIGDARDRLLSTTVECTVFQISTPAGEVVTLPVSEVRSFHALSEDLLKRMEEAARAKSERRSGRAKGGAETAEEPFGFAAFRSLKRSRPDLEEGPAI